MTKRVGRPPSDNPKKNEYRIRMSDDELKMLNECCEVLGCSKADVVRLGIEKVYGELEK